MTIPNFWTFVLPLRELACQGDERMMPGAVKHLATRVSLDESAC